MVVGLTFAEEAKKHLMDEVIVAESAMQVSAFGAISKI